MAYEYRKYDYLSKWWPDQSLFYFKIHGLHRVRSCCDLKRYTRLCSDHENLNNLHNGVFLKKRYKVTESLCRKVLCAFYKCRTLNILSKILSQPIWNGTAKLNIVNATR